MTERRVSVRLAAVGGQALKDDLRAVGRDGKAALEALAGGAPGASRGLASVGGSAEAAAARLESLSARSAQLAASLSASAAATATLSGRINQLTGVTGGMVRQADDIAAYGQELDRTRAKYNPMFATIQRYRAELAGIREAHRVGAISASEMTAAISRERQIALGSIAALKGRTTALNQMGVASRNASWQSRNLMFQLNDVGVSLAGGMNPLMVLAQQGTQISQIYAGQGGVNAALKDTGGMITGVARAHPLVTAAVIGSTVALAGMRHEINQTTSASVTMGDTLSGIWGAIRDGIMSYLRPAFDALAPWFDGLWGEIVSGVKTFGNTVINGFRLVAMTIKTVFVNIPNIIGGAVIGAANGVLTAIESLINKSLAKLQWLADKVAGFINKIPGVEGVDFSGTFGKAPPLPKIPNPFAARNRRAWKGFEAQYEGIKNSDPMGGFFDSVRDRAVARAEAREAEEAGEGAAGRAGGGSAGAAREEADAVGQLVEQLNKELATLRETDPIKKKMLEYTDQLAGATAEQRNQVLSLVQALDQENTGFAAISRSLKEYAEEAKRIGDDIGSVFVGAFKGIEDAVGEFVKTGKLSFSDMVTSMLADLAKLSIRKSILGPMSNALSGALSGIAGGGGSWGSAISSWLNHDGGRAGTGARLSIPAYAIAGAPRFHNGGGFGLRSDEQVSVLQRGERVLNRRQTREWEGGGGTNVNIYARDAASFRQSRAQVASDISRAVSFGRRSL